MSRWDPAHYLAFGQERLLPGLDLIGSIPEFDPGLIVDLGCGEGTLTAALADRWPGAGVTGVDRSEEMLSAARRARPHLRWRQGDIATWRPAGQVDLIFSNSALHWLEDHGPLFLRLTGYLSEMGMLAVQMPNNWAEPTHTIPASILDAGDWPEAAVQALPRQRVAAADRYREWLPGARVWEVSYEHLLKGDDAVYEWATGSFLRPPLAAMSAAERERFARRCKLAYRAAYPARPDGTTALRYRRLFVLASSPATSAPS